MKKNQLTALNIAFEQLEELKKAYERIERGYSALYFSEMHSDIIEDIVRNVLKKYENLASEDLKEEIKKREKELESISILRLNKLV